MTLKALNVELSVNESVLPTQEASMCFIYLWKFRVLAAQHLPKAAVCLPTPSSPVHRDVLCLCLDLCTGGNSCFLCCPLPLSLWLTRPVSCFSLCFRLPSSGEKWLLWDPLHTCHECFTPDTPLSLHLWRPPCLLAAPRDRPDPRSDMDSFCVQLVLPLLQNGLDLPAV